MGDAPTDWVERARRIVPPEDRRVLSSPARLLWRFARFPISRIEGRAARAPVDDVCARDPELVGLVLEFFDRFARHYFRLRIEGIENVPTSGPVLLVANHNGGLVPTDGFFTALAMRQRFGPKRGLYVLVHDFLLEDPMLRSYAQRLGMLRANRNSAHRALSEGHCLLVYPGSDFDAFRPFHDRGRIVLAGRTGFLRVALREQVPIVPVVTAGTHEQFFVLARGDRLARLIHAHALGRVDILPLIWALPWGVCPGFLPYIPLPAQTTVSFGAPITWPELSPESAERPDVLDRCYREVEGRMQAMLDRLMEGRRFLLGKRRASR